MPSYKLALVHDFLKEYGGAERVLEALHEIWPKAPIFTSFVDRKGLGSHQDRIKDWNIITSFAQKIPFFSRLYSPLRFLAPLFFQSFDFSGYDVVISSTNAYYAKSIRTEKPTIHICYCHTPPRSLYGYPTRMDWKKNTFIRIYGEIINYFLRKVDFRSGQKVDYFIANSKVVKERIWKFYRRDAKVIYPPVELKSKVPPPSRLRRAGKTKKYFLYVGKLAAAKNVDLAVKAAIELGIKLKLVGSGVDKSKLRSLTTGTFPDRSKVGVEFLGEVSDGELIDLYRNCEAVIFPAVDEDFGIVPVEAMSFGKPVIALKSGGVVETVVDGKTGVFFEKPSVESLIIAIKQFNTLSIKPADCIKQAEKFKKEVFKKKIQEFVDSKRILS